ncbi:MutS-related protein [Hymenobacter sp. HD11105]
MWTSSRTRLRRLEAAWHQPAARSPYFPLIARYYDALQHEPAYQRLPDQTWADLNGDLLFGLLDATVSRVGQQCLYHRLRSPLADEVPLQDFEAAATLLAQQPGARGHALLALDQLSAHEAYYLTDLLQGQPLPPLPGARCAPLLALGLVATLLGGFWLPVLWFGTGAFALTNAVFHFWQHARIKRQVRSLLHLGRLHRAGQALLRAALPLRPLQALAAPLVRLGALVRQVAFFQVEADWQSDLAAPVVWLFDLLKMLLLLDVLLYARCRVAVQQHAPAIRTVFEAVGYVDCALAVASFRQRHATCVPHFGPAAAGIQLQGGYHPLVPGCVPNDLTLAGPGVLLTGSNMAGKTTFMRTLGVNALLAQTIATCPATAYRAPFCRVLTSLSLADSLPTGKSYYLVEAETMRQLLLACEAAPGSYLLLLDELFKGTNTQERIAANTAVLAYLQPRSWVVAATHDGELGALLQSCYAEYHFCETVTAADWYFDYRLKVGPLTTRNAIRLLARLHYPAPVVAAAQALSATLASRAQPSSPQLTTPGELSSVADSTRREENVVG